MNTKEKIIEKAMDLMLKSGYESVSLNDIAREVGIAKPSLYHHFKGKEEIFRNVTEQFFSESSKWMAPFSEEDTRFEDALRHIFKSVEDVMKLMESGDNKRGYGFYFLMFDALKMFADVRDKYETEYRQDYETVEISLIRAEGKGEIRKNTNRKALALMISAMIEGVFLINTLYPEAEFKDISEEFTEIIMRGISAKGGGDER